jgi:hemolysin activation/secretion protein
MSLFVELGYYENLGEISTSTLFGEVLAHSAKLTYSQRLGSDSRWILVSQYRYFKQKIIPRDKEVEDLHTGTDMVSVTARYRLGDGIWTDPASELYFGASKYFKNSTDLRGDKEEPVVGDFVLAGYKHEW